MRMDLWSSLGLLDFFFWWLEGRWKPAKPALLGPVFCLKVKYGSLYLLGRVCLSEAFVWGLSCSVQSLNAHYRV